MLISSVKLFLKAQDSDDSVSRHYLGLVIFESVSFVHNQTGPLNGTQHSLVDGDQLIGCQQDVELDRGVFLQNTSNQILEKQSVQFGQNFLNLYS